ncbi:Peptidyl-prolyl cis-trans isomerase FKBP8 [Fasciola gigantica]|uniref:peptidylprolyl isomerase n=1 Tax=Fasciola gigantica TaxID=46835 RepID=A0A504YWK5_FASGI|nr:Peptidyl-prolyl cis-trans isomerase FKBP8 [Fasciola gigantica]
MPVAGPNPTCTTLTTVPDAEDGPNNDVQPGGDVESNEIPETKNSETSSLADFELVDKTRTIELNTNHVVSACDDGNIDEKLDILGNGLITKQVIEKGLGRETRPNHGDVVTVSYKCWLEEGDILVEDVSELTFTVGDGDVIHAFDLAMPLAEVREKFELIADARFAYGSRGKEPDIPSNAKLRYHIQLLSSDDPPQYTAMPGHERLSLADQKREKGNYYFRREEYESAMNSYLKALKILSPTSVDHEIGTVGVSASGADLSYDCVKEMDNLILKLHNNLAATQLKIQAFDAAIRSCDIVLRKEPQNFKALFRKGRALVSLGNADEAIPVLRQVLELVPNSAMAAGELQLARTMQQNERERWSRVAKRMSPQSNCTTRKMAFAGSSSFRSLLRSRWMLFTSALVFALLSIGLTWYTKPLSRISISWPGSTD